MMSNTVNFTVNKKIARIKIRKNKRDDLKGKEEVRYSLDEGVEFVTH